MSAPVVVTGSGRGLTIRWDLSGAGDDVVARLATYISTQSYDRFAALPGLEFKLWRVRDGVWFEGCYLFRDAAACEQFAAEFCAGQAEAPGSLIIGHGPVELERWDPMALVEGPEGFAALRP